MKRSILGPAVLLTSTVALAHVGSHGLYAPETVNVVTIGGSASISWSASTDASSYRVYRNGGEIASGITDLSFTDTDLSNNNQYDYFVIACDTQSVCSDGSETMSITYMGQSHGEGDGESCAVSSGSTSNIRPTDLQLSSTGELTWVPPSDSIKWNVYRNSNYEYTVTNGVPSYTIENHSDGNEYYVTAVYPDGFISTKSELAIPGGSHSHDCARTLEVNVTLTAENATLSSENAALRLQIEQLTAANAALIASNSGGSDTDSAVQAQIAQLIADNNSLTAVNVERETTNTRLEANNVSLTSINDQLSSENSTLSAANTELVADNSSLNATIADNTVTIQALNTTIATFDNGEAAAVLEIALANEVAEHASCEANLGAAGAAEGAFAIALLDTQTELVNCRAQLRILSGN